MRLSKPTIHIVYIVPQRSGIAGYYNLLAQKISYLPPLYRCGMESLTKWPKPTYAPYSISKHLISTFQKNYKIKLYDWNETKTARMGNDDILLFHPKPKFSINYANQGIPDGIDTQSIGWKTVKKYPDCKSIIIIPYTHDDNNGWLTPLLQLKTMNMIAICDKFWTKEWESSPYNSFVKKLLQVNMSIDSKDYPLLKTSFSPKGERKFLYIGHTSGYKNTEQLEKIANSYPNFKGAHIGYGDVKGWEKIADRIDLSSMSLHNIVKEYDIFVNCSRADAQATTILEQMCIGMAIACTPQSGYSYSTITSLSVDNTEYNCQQLKKLQYVEEKELVHNAILNRQNAQKYHSWQVFSQKILEFIQN